MKLYSIFQLLNINTQCQHAMSTRNIDTGIWRDNYGSSSTTSPAHGALSPFTATIASRGIATTQPGLEDATQTVSPGGLVPPAAKKRFLFRRALTGGSGADKAQEIAAAVAEKEKVKAPLAAGSGERGSRAKSPGKMK